MDTAAIDSPPAPLRPGLRDLWMLRSDITFLNHGSFGGTPRVVFDAQNDWRRRIEAEPVEILARQSCGLLAEARQPIGKWLGMNPDDFGFVTNATEGVNAVLRSLPLSPGDELLTTDHVYGAVRQALRLVTRTTGAILREVKIPLPVHSAREIEQIVVDAISPRTKLLLIDHVTSPTALIFPVQSIAAECAKRGVDVLMDAAHAPGMVPVDVEKIGATYYVANLHKWVCAPKGSAFLWVTPQRQKLIHPAVISHHLDEGFSREFGWQGTRDMSSWLTVPRAISFMAELGWENVMHHNHQLAAWAHRLLCRVWKVQPISPLDGSMLGSIASIPLPPPLNAMTLEQTIALGQRLYSEFRIEVPLMHWNGHVLLRVAAQVYNTGSDYERAADVIANLARAI